MKSKLNLKKIDFLGFVSTALILLGFSQLSLAAQSNGYFGTSQPTHPVDEVWLDCRSEPTSLDPAKVLDVVSGGIIENLFLRLVQFDPVTHKIVPDLAASWQMSLDQKTYTFKLRKDIYWSDGKPITAHDVKFSLERLIDPSLASPSFQQAKIIRNIEAKDNTTVVIYLIQPVPFFLELIEQPSFGVVPQHVVKKFAGEKENEWYRPQHIVVSGPFILKDEKFKQYKWFEKNPRYYESQKVKVNRIKVVMFEDETASLNAYKMGEYDFSWASSIPLHLLDEIKAYKDFQQSPKLSTYYFNLNTSRSPLDQKKVRQALSLAIDREQLNQYILRGMHQPTDRFVPLGIDGYHSTQGRWFDPERARLLLQESGYGPTKKFPDLTVTLNTSGNHKIIAQAIVEMWQKHLGIKVKITNMEFSSLLQAREKGDYDILRDGWSGDFMDPYAFLYLFQSDQNHPTAWKDKKFDLLVLSALEEKNRKKRMNLYLKAEELLLEETPIIPIYHLNQSFLKKPYLKGLWPHPMHRHPWKHFWVEVE